MAVVLTLSACVDLTSPWDKKTQNSGALDARGRDGMSDLAVSGGGGSGGRDGAGRDSLPGQQMDATVTVGGDAPVDEGQAGGLVDGGAADVSVGTADSQRADAGAEVRVVVDGNAPRDTGVRRDSSDGGGQTGPVDSSGGSGGNGGMDAVSDSRVDSLDAKMGMEVASDGPLLIEVGADLAPHADVGVDLAPDLAPDLGPDLAPDLRPDATPDLSPDQSLCKPTVFDAKQMSNNGGYAESDGWYLSGSGLFLYKLDVEYLAGRITVTVVARGDYVNGAWPTMDVSAERGHSIGTATVNSSTMTAYRFTFDTAAVKSAVGVTAMTGNGVHVQSVTISCPSH